MIILNYLIFCFFFSFFLFCFLFFWCVEDGGFVHMYFPLFFFCFVSFPSSSCFSIILFHVAMNNNILTRPSTNYYHIPVFFCFHFSLSRTHFFSLRHNLIKPHYPCHYSATCFISAPSLIILTLFFLPYLAWRVGVVEMPSLLTINFSSFRTTFFLFFFSSY